MQYLNIITLPVLMNCNDCVLQTTIIIATPAPARQQRLRLLNSPLGKHLMLLYAARNILLLHLQVFTAVLQ